jgi:hypothetical protein
MNSVARTILIVAVIWIVAWTALRVLGIVLGIIHLVMPLVILGAIGYGVYWMFGRKSLPGGRRTLM